MLCNEIERENARRWMPFNFSDRLLMRVCLFIYLLSICRWHIRFVGRRHVSLGAIFFCDRAKQQKHAIVSDNKYLSYNLDFSLFFSRLHHYFGLFCSDSLFSASLTVLFSFSLIISVTLCLFLPSVFSVLLSFFALFPRMPPRMCTFDDNDDRGWKLNKKPSKRQNKKNMKW